jgi:dienelactone hydrolase
MAGAIPQYELERHHICISYAEPTTMREVYNFASSHGAVGLDGFLMTPKGKPSKTLLMYMHPAATVHRLPLPMALAERGFHVLAAGSRYNRNDAPVIMEKVLHDYAAYVRHAKEVLGYEKVIACGWSGGGSLTAFYQAQAENPTVDQTPSGEPIDLTNLIPADAMMFHAAHLSRAQVLLEFIDPSVLDEYNPDIRDPELDIYDPRNPNKPPFSTDYIEYFRKKQLERIRRRTGVVKELLDKIKRNGGVEHERGLVLHRSLADPRWIDASLDPNDRKPNWCFLGEPEGANTSPAGIARFSTLRGWLSQWSIDDTNALAARHAPNISVPLLAIENTADDAVPGWHTKAFFDAVTAKDATYKIMKGANHYYHNQPEHLREAVELIAGWLTDRNLAD